MKVTVIAQKSTRYRSKLYRKGESFDVSARTARLYGALGRARLAAEDSLSSSSPPAPVAQIDPAQALQPAPAPAAIVEPAPDTDAIVALRAEYAALMEMPADRRWGEARLGSEIEAIKTTRAQAGNLL